MNKLLVFFTSNWKFCIVSPLLAVAVFELIHMRSDLDSIQQKAATLSSSVSSIRSDVGTLQEDVRYVQEDSEAMREDVGAIADILENIQSGLDRQAQTSTAMR